MGGTGTGTGTPTVQQNGSVVVKLSDGTTRTYSTMFASTTSPTCKITVGNGFTQYVLQLYESQTAGSVSGSACLVTFTDYVSATVGSYTTSLKLVSHTVNGVVLQ